MNSKSKLLVLSSLFVSLTCTLASCGAEDITEIKKRMNATESSEFWGVRASEKVVQNRDNSYYNYSKKNASIEITSCRGEYELGQIVVTPKNDVKYFNARISDLTTSDGFFYSKEDITVYVAKYLDIKTIYDTATNENRGFFPDALVPIEGIKYKNENKIQAGMNQSFYISTNTKTTQKPGLYKGTLYIQLEQTEYSVDVSVNVVDYTVSEETHSKSLFLNQWQYESAEMNSTQEEFDRYNLECLKYRLSPDKVIKDKQLDSSDESIARYTEKAYEFMHEPNCTNVCIPYATVWDAKYSDATFDADLMKRYIRSYYVKSIENNFNMFEKSSFYLGGLIDEPDDFGMYDRTKRVTDLFKQTITEIADELDEFGYKSNEIHDELIVSIRKLKNIVTCAYSEMYDGVIDCWCPKANFYHTEEQREHYELQEEKWWYTCVIPRAPYPTYHIEDGLTSARMLSWMQAEYDVVGNLYWATNVYAYYNGHQYMPIEDYYTEGDRFAGVNGDGFLFYAGEIYGYDHPLGSIRLESIRDGLEEYEMFYDIKNKYAELGLDNSGLFTFLNHYLYEGTKVNGGTKETEEARASLLNLLLANKNGSDFLITDCNYDDVNAKVDLKFYVNNSSNVKVNGVEPTIVEPYANGKIYTFTKALNGETNEIEISAINGNKINTFKHNLGGLVLSYGPNDINNGFSKYNAYVSASIEEVAELGQMVKLDITEVNGKKQSIKYTPNFINKVNKDTTSVLLNFYNNGEEDIEFHLGGRYNGNSVDNFFLENQILKAKSMTTIRLSASDMTLKSAGGLDYFMFVFGKQDNSGVEEAKSVYLKDVILTF